METKKGVEYTMMLNTMSVEYGISSFQHIIGKKKASSIFLSHSFSLCVTILGFM